MKVLLIIPCYNEEKNVQRVYDSILAFNKKSKKKYSCIFINDGSKDSTEQELVACKAPHVTLAQNLGIGGAVQTGYKYAYENAYDIAVQMDGDGQHDINCVQDIIEPIENNGVDLVIGSRFVNKSSSEFQSSFLRRLGIKVISAAIKLKTGKQILDTTSGFRAVGKRLIREFAAEYPTEYPEPISTTFAIKSGCSITEVPVVMHERAAGVSSIRAWKSVYYMVNVVLSILLLRVNKREGE